MNYYVIKTKEYEEAILAAKDDGDASRFCEQDGEMVIVMRIHIDNKSVLKTDAVWTEYLQELYGTKLKADDAFSEATINYENALYEAPEHIRDDFK